MTTREFVAAVKVEAEDEAIRDTWPAPPLESFAECGCFFPAMGPPEGKEWAHKPGCPDADLVPPPGFGCDGR